MKYLSLLLLLLVFSCEQEKDNLPTENKDDTENQEQQKEFQTDTVVVENDITEPTIEKGIYGFIIEWTGDFMPGPDGPSGTIDTVQKEVYIYKLLTYDSIANARIVADGVAFYHVDSIRQKSIAVVKTNNMGFYQVELDSGSYSGFIKIDKIRLFFNGSDGDGHINPINIKTDTLLHIDLNIDYNKMV